MARTKTSFDKEASGNWKMAYFCCSRNLVPKFFQPRSQVKRTRAGNDFVVAIFFVLVCALFRQQKKAVNLSLF